MRFSLANALGAIGILATALAITRSFGGVAMVFGILAGVTLAVTFLLSRSLDVRVVIATVTLAAIVSWSGAYFIAWIARYERTMSFGMVAGGFGTLGAISGLAVFKACYRAARRCQGKSSDD